MDDIFKPTHKYTITVKNPLPSATITRKRERDMSEKTLHNSDVSGARQNVKDIVVFGAGDTFKLLCKASSKAEGWMKSTKAMEIPGVGCVVQVTTQQGSNVSEALTFVPGVEIATFQDGGGNVTARRLQTIR